MNGTHAVFDSLAALAALGATGIVYRWRLADVARFPVQAAAAYGAALIAGAAVGGFALGTVNLYLSGRPGIGRSFVGALLGAIAGVEALKLRRGIRGSTGLVFVPGLCASVAVGRLGCLLAGVEDFTYGTPTDLAWGWDFGDGIARHPVQLYEALAMLAFLAVTMVFLHRRAAFFARNGFYLVAGWYGLQRYVWEFWKPYAPVIGRLNVFHLAALALILYAVVMIVRTEHAWIERPA